MNVSHPHAKTEPLVSMRLTTISVSVPNVMLVSIVKKVSIEKIVAFFISTFLLHFCNCMSLSIPLFSKFYLNLMAVMIEFLLLIWVVMLTLRGACHRRRREIEVFMREFFIFSEINECDSAPCKNGGTCKEEDGGVTSRAGFEKDVEEFYTCVCKPGYTGKNCETGKNEL